MTLVEILRIACDAGGGAEQAEEGWIIKIESIGKADGNWSSDPRLRQVNVLVCTASCALTGTAHLMSQQRLLDELNTGVAANLHHLGGEFLPLTEVRLFYPGGATDVAVSTHVKKSNILFVAERGVGQCERNGARELKTHPCKVKKPLSAKVYMPPHTVEGKMHVAVWQELAQVLDSDNRFLPVTDAVISPSSLNGESAFAFAAINKDQIAHIGEVSEALLRLREDVRRALSAEQREMPDLAETRRS